MVSAKDFFQQAQSCLAEIERQEMDKIRRVAEVTAQSILDDGIVHVFGSGHSSMPAREIHIRAGSLSNVEAIGLDRIIGKFERIEGIAKVLLGSYDLRTGEVLIVISNSGINALPIEMALEGNKLGLFTVAVTSMQHSSQVKSRHSSGKRLFEVTDEVIDTHVPYGDASLEVPGFPFKVGPLSTFAGVAITNAIVVETVGQIVARGGTPPVRISRNMPGGDEHNEQFKLKYGARIKDLLGGI
jgi:uncharacterized phosphosugar-binding protein